MSLQYRFIGRDSRPNSVTVAAASFALWLEDRKGLRPDLSVNGRRAEGEGREIAVLRGRQDRTEAVRFVLYEENPDGRWSTTLTAIEDSGESWIWVDLEWVSEDPWGRTPKVMPPALVSYLLADGTVSLEGVPLHRAVQFLDTMEAVAELGALIVSPGRNTPVVVVSPDRTANLTEHRRRADLISRELAGVAPVYLLSTSAQDALNQALPDGLAVYGGAVRTYMPGVSSGAAALQRHRVLGVSRLQLDAARSANIVAAPLRARALALRPPAVYRDRAVDLLRPVAASDDALLQMAESLAAEQTRSTVEEETAQLREQLDWQTYVADETERELAKTQARVAFLTQQLSEHKVFAESLETPARFAIREVETFAEVLEAAGDLSRVVVGDTASPSAVLDGYPEAGSWAKRTWRALLALDSYVLSREQGFAGDFRAWCLAPPEGVTSIPAAWLALKESDSTTNSAKYRGARVFSVPAHVQSEGRVYMESHVKIVPGGRPAPRLHFFDDSLSSVPRIYVGYIGPHLPNGQTN